MLSHKSEQLPYEQAGTLISRWNKEAFRKRRVLFLEVVSAPFIFIFVCAIVSLLWNLKEILETQTMVSEISTPALILSLILTDGIVYTDFLIQKTFSNECYEFREKGIYYLNKEHQKHRYRMALKKDVHQFYDFVAYEDIAVFKVWFSMIAKAPVNGGNAYQVDFYIITKQDECIRIHTGVFGTSDEKVRLTAEILKEKAAKIKDPYHILDHLDDEASDFYAYLDEQYREREHARVRRNLAKRAGETKKEVTLF